MSDQPRAVWLTREEASQPLEILRSISTVSPESAGAMIALENFLRALSATWEAAPPDPAEAVYHAIYGERALLTSNAGHVPHVLAALGFVVSSTETSTPDE